jgi:uncharacterized YccA/Bax inhibitor family protein
MRSNNPVFARSAEFNGTATTSQNAYGNTTFPGAGGAQPGYGTPQQQPYTDPSTWSTGAPGAPGAPVTTERMTIDSVVQKTALTLALVFIGATLTWLYIGNVDYGTGLADQANIGKLSAAILIGSGGAFILSLVNSFKKVISPALVLAFAALEGVALGALSKAFEAWFGGGIVMTAMLGTFGALAGTLATYRFFNIKVGGKFRIFVISAMFGMVGLSLLTLVLSFFGIDTGMFGFGTTGLITAIIGLTLGIFMLILDFDFIENGIAAGLPERESWRAAFGLTVSLVWIYTNLLRILAILRSN